jgi:hypothetical protein
MESLLEPRRLLLIARYFDAVAAIMNKPEAFTPTAIHHKAEWRFGLLQKRLIDAR